MALETARTIVLTGGPGAGKTVVAEEVHRRLGGAVVLVPESATHVYTALGTRWDRLDTPARREVQRRMYQWQLEQERQTSLRNPDRPMLLDRGTIDGAAYWPDGPEAFFPAMGTTLEAELARYDRVIFLDTAAALGLYDGDVSNTVRFESAEQAIASGNRLLGLWGGHPNLRHVAAYVDLEHKIQAVLDLVRSELKL